MNEMGNYVEQLLEQGNIKNNYENGVIKNNIIIR